MLNLINFILDAFSQHSYLAPISFLVINSNNAKLRNEYLEVILAFLIMRSLITVSQFCSLRFAKINLIFILMSLYYIINSY